ncbi:MAG: holo-ACP synthase [Candidatus Latescibacterota bacterium]|nr:MAG: holo-ACP synthase [Candidatus Latescibacterota bacterium]
MSQSIARHGDRFLQRVFTPQEIEYCRSLIHAGPHWAARFAAKEALFKAVSPGILDVLVWREIGVSRHESGAPSLQLSGGTQEKLTGWRFALALSHTRTLAIAQVIALPPGADLISGDAPAL